MTHKLTLIMAAAALAMVGCKKSKPAGKPQTPAPDAQAAAPPVTPAPDAQAAAPPAASPDAQAATPVTPEPAKPSHAGGPGPALALTGDVKAGQVVFAAKCK